MSGQAHRDSEYTGPRMYVAMGDSFTAGPAGSRQPPFADHLALLLREASPSMLYANVAEPGATSVEVSDYQLLPAINLVPDVITLVSGGNDALLSVRPDVGAHMTALENLLEMLTIAVPQALIVTATTPDPGRYLPLGPRTAARIATAMERINEATRAAAARQGVPCLDIAAHPEALARGNYARDGYHPSPEASRRIAMAFASLIGVRLGIHVDTQEVI